MRWSLSQHYWGNFFAASGPFQTTPEEFENGGFTLKTHEMFFVHTTPEEFKNATITGYFKFVFEENSVSRGNYMIIIMYANVFENFRFKMFPVHNKAKNWCFQIPLVWTEFSKSFVFVTD